MFLMLKKKNQVNTEQNLYSALESQKKNCFCKHLVQRLSIFNCSKLFEADFFINAKKREVFKLLIALSRRY